MNMYYSLNSLKGVMYGIIYGASIGGTKGDARSSDYSSYDVRLSFLVWQNRYIGKCLIVFRSKPPSLESNINPHPTSYELQSIFPI